MECTKEPGMYSEFEMGFCSASGVDCCISLCTSVRTWRCTSGRGVFFSEALQVRFGRSVDSVIIRDLAMYKWAGCLFF